MTKLSAMTTYHAQGPVRGSCGHSHRGITAALACARKDQRSCARLGGGAYSDRSPQRTDGRALTDAELAEVEDQE